MADKRAVWVGSFIFGALSLAVVAVVLLSGRHLFEKTIPAVAYFQGSVSGLEIGSPVTFRGVRIGTVKEMRVTVNAVDLQSSVPVYIEINPTRIDWTDGTPRLDPADLRRAIEAGLRAHLSTQSLVTGQLAVELDFQPKTLAGFVGRPVDLVTIPTIPSDVEFIKSQLLGLNLPDLGDKARATLASLHAIIDALNQQVAPLSESALQTSAAARKTLSGVDDAIDTLKADTARSLGRIDKLADVTTQQVAARGAQIEAILQKIDRDSAEIGTLSHSLNDITGPHSPMRADIAASLRDLAASLDSLRGFTRDLARNPAGTLLSGHIR